MRKIITFTHATLDGYIDDPHEWSFQYSDEELQDHGLKMTLRADALLLGRITYEGMAQAWAHQERYPLRRPRQLDHQVRRRLPTGRHHGVGSGRGHRRPRPA